METVLLWAQHVARRRMGFDLEIDDMAEVDRLHESGELEDYYAAQRHALQERYRAEGRAQVLSQQRDLLRQQAALKFDLGTATRLASILSGIEQAEEMARAGELIIACATGEELIERVGDVLAPSA